MTRCPTCTHENIAASTYCERCGTVLTPASSPAAPTYRTTSGPPPPPPESALATRPAYLYAPRRTRRRTRTGGETILSILLYLWAVFWASIGLASIFLYGTPTSTISAPVFVVCCVVGLVLLIPLLRKRTRLSLGTWKRLFLELSLGVIGFLVLAVALSVLPAATQGYERDATLSFVFVVYGLLTAVIAFW